MQAFAFQPVRLELGIFRFECIKACLRHDLSRHVESVPRNMKWKLAIKFPTPNSPPPPPAAGKTNFIKFPPSRAVKDIKCQGYARGGGGGDV